MKIGFITNAPAICAFKSLRHHVDICNPLTCSRFTLSALSTIQIIKPFVNLFIHFFVYSSKER